MRLILKKDVPGLGKKGDIKEVHDGYGRNFLLPRGAAEVALPNILNKLSAEKNAHEKHLEKEKSEIIALKTKIDKLNLDFKVKIGEKGQPFGSITPTKILSELEKSGINIKKEMLPAESIKTLGSHTIKIRLLHNIEAELKIHIEPEK